MAFGAVKPHHPIRRERRARQSCKAQPVSCFPKGGTEGSNPSPSSKESANFRSRSGGRIGVRNIASRSAWPVPSASSANSSCRVSGNCRHAQLYGKRRLREMDRRIRFLSKRAESAEVVDPNQQRNRDQVFFGATVT